MKFANRLKQLREDENLSREELAKKLNVSYSTIAKYETGARFPDQDMLEKIADIFDTTLDFLLGRTDIRDGVIIDKNQLPEELKDIGVEHLVVAKYAKDKDIDSETLKQIIDVISKNESNRSN